jgi:hypothetical protein
MTTVSSDVSPCANEEKLDLCMDHFDEGKHAGMHWLIFNLDELYIPIQDPMYIPIVVDFTQLDFVPSNKNMKKYVCYMSVYLHKCTCIYICIYMYIYICICIYVYVCIRR